MHFPSFVLFWSDHPTLPLSLVGNTDMKCVRTSGISLLLKREQNKSPCLFSHQCTFNSIQLSSIRFPKSKINPVWLFFFYILLPFFLDFWGSSFTFAIMLLWTYFSQCESKISQAVLRAPWYIATQKICSANILKSYQHQSKEGLFA